MRACEFLSKDYMAFDAGELPVGVIVNKAAMTWRQRGMTLKPLLSRLGCP